MCGICGLINTNQMVDAERAIRTMTETMCHRGPDDEGFILDGSVTLGMRRLSIIDLPGGHQPIFNEDGTVAVIFNGEIYNFRDLCQELVSLGHRFSTGSDTEVIVHAYEEWGLECVHRFRGMFSFGVYDRRSHTTNSGDQSSAGNYLFLARDRLGIKPLYYYQGNGFFLFASEVRALLASGLVPNRLSLDGLYSYLIFGSVQEPLTLIEGVHSLPPGHRMTVDVQRATFTIQRYWDLPNGIAEEGNGRERVKVREELRAILEEAVRLRLVSDVPLGAFLSGGIDSGAVVALMRQAAKTQVKTFTITFEEQEFNEADMARLMAKGFDTDHTEVKVTGAQALIGLPGAFKAMDQPTMDGINTYYVSSAAKKAGLTVALSGLGGDELFAGYPTFSIVPRLQKLQTLIRRFPVLVLSSWPLFRLLPSSDARRKLQALIAGDIPFTHSYFLARALFTPLTPLLTPDAQIGLSEDTPWHQRVEGTLTRARTYDPVNAVSYLECTHYLVSTLLRDTDQMSMAHSLEVRVPLLDHKLVEFMIRLPGNFKIRNSQLMTRNLGNTPKPLLVSALNGTLPDGVVYRKKSTFTFPWERWLRGPLRKEVGQTLECPPKALYGLLDSKALHQVWQGFLKGHTSWSRPWALYVLFKWVEIHC